MPQHRAIVPYFGGLAIAGASSLAWVLLPAFGRAEPCLSGASHVVAPAAAFLTLGAYDDLRPLTPARKLLAQTVLATLAACLGTVVRVTGLCTVDLPLSVVTIVALVNAFNFTDVCDGLLAGVAAVSLLGVSNLLVPGPPLAPLLLSGALLGFLPYNSPPASIFLGDAGSHLLGFAAAAGLAAVSRATPPWPGVPGALLVLGVPLFEAVFITSIRIARGKPWWRGSPDHFALRLQAAGLSRASTDRVAYVAAAGFAFAGLVFAHGGPGQQAIAAGSAVVVATLAWRALLRWEVPQGRRSVAGPWTTETMNSGPKVSGASGNEDSIGWPSERWHAIGPSDFSPSHSSP